MPVSNVLGLNSGTAAVLNGLAQPGGLNYVLAYDRTNSYLRFFDGVTVGGLRVAMYSDIASTLPSATTSPVANTTGVALSAAAFCPGAGAKRAFVLRSGPTASFNDTTPSATAIVNALAGVQVGQLYDLFVMNTTAQQQTITAGSNVTLVGATDGSGPAVFTIGGQSSRLLYVQVTSIGPNTVSIYG